MELIVALDQQLQQQAEQILLHLEMAAGALLQELDAGEDPYQILTELHRVLLDIRRQADDAQWAYLRKLFEFPESVPTP